MSRHTIEHPEHAEVTVGWDRPMGTFFLQVHGPEDELGPGECLHWIGRKSGEITCERTLVLRAEKLGIDIPINILRELIEDRHEGR